MLYDDETHTPPGFEIDPKQMSKVTIPMGFDAFVTLLRGWRTQGWSAEQIMKGLKENGVKGIEKKNVESFLRR